MKKRKRQDVCVASVYGVMEGSVQKTLFYLFNQVITLSTRHFWMAGAEIKVFMKSDLQLPGISKECQLNLCYLCKS